MIVLGDSEGADESGEDGVVGEGDEKPGVVGDIEVTIENRLGDGRPGERDACKGSEVRAAG